MDQLTKKYSEVREFPFPALGRSVGDFVLYDSLLVGAVDSHLKGKTVIRSTIPQPDNESVQFVEALHLHPTRSVEEDSFLAYFRALEELREELEAVTL